MAYNLSFCRYPRCSSYAATKTVKSIPADRNSPERLTSARFCPQHCCSAFYGPETCLNHHDPYDSVCDLHTYCSVLGCSLPRYPIPDPRQRPGLGMPETVIRAETCIRHKCHTGDCRKARISSKSPHCKDHTCRADSCRNPVIGNSSCCLTHKCRMAGCLSLVERDKQYCSSHMKCSRVDCGRTRLWSSVRGDYDPYCHIHTPEPPSVHLPAQLQNENRGRTLHTSIPRGTICRDRNCDFRASEDRPYCGHHTCMDPGCAYPRPWTLEGKYCPMHTCREPACLAHVGSKSIYCEYHVCSLPKCNAIAVSSETQLCLDHLNDFYNGTPTARPLVRARSRSRRRTRSQSRTRELQSRDVIWGPRPVFDI
ncbi:hypothetical protein B0T24DRAFT_630559 [Lasiosphaeria ovina]|uniref:Uncharacterized protein n=1 Tax=Lasiosphaeria ovina TaxID=92902 RepID=A0AAE0K824_9PEZI|nr:hypothetical protein B0T24DRAFT_630559 [Lasiosphaeria ovina]